MESHTKTKSESYYEALLDNPKRASKILNEIFDEDEKNMKNINKNKVKENEIAKI